MGSPGLQNVLSMLAFKQNQRLSDAKLNMDSEAQKSAADAEKERIKLETQRVNDEHDYHQGLMSTATQLRKLQRFEQLQKITDSGSVPVGSTALNGATPEGGGQYQLPDAFNDENGKDTILNLPSPMAAARLKADRERVLLAPKEEAQQRTDAAKLEEQAANKADDRKFQVQLQKQSQDHQDYLASLMRSSQERVATIRSKGGNLDPITFSNYMHGVGNGTNPLEEIPTADRPEVLNAAVKAGIKPLNKKDSQKIAEIAKAASVIPFMDQYLNEMPDSDSTAGAAIHAPGMYLNSRAQQAMGQLESNLPNISVLSSGVNRLSTPEMGMVAKGLKPNPFLSKKSNIKTREDYVKALKKMVESGFPGAPPGQVQDIMHTAQLDSIKPYTKNGDVNMDKVNALFSPGGPQQ